MKVRRGSLGFRMSLRRKGGEGGEEELEVLEIGEMGREEVEDGRPSEGIVRRHHC